MEDVRKIFIENLRRLRRARDLTQEEMAEAAGVTHTYYGIMERGGHWPRVATLQRIAEKLNVHCWELFFDQGDPSSVFPFLSAIQGRLDVQDEHIKKALKLLKEIANDRDHINSAIIEIQERHKKKAGQGSQSDTQLNRRFEQLATMLYELRSQMKPEKKGSGTDGDGASS